MTTPWTEKTTRLETLGAEYIEALETLRRIVPELGDIARDMDAAVNAGEIATLNAAGAFRVANGLVVRSLRVLEDIDTDAVHKPVFALMKTINPVRKSHGKEELAAGPRVDKKTSLIPPTGCDMRDRMVRVLAHSLVTPQTAVGAAVEMEFSMYGLYGAATDQYCTTGRRIFEALSPRSPSCRPLLRHMIFTGMISPAELVRISAEELVVKEREAQRELVQCRPGWLADQLRRSQSPYIQDARSDHNAQSDHK